MINSVQKVSCVCVVGRIFFCESCYGTSKVFLHIGKFCITENLCFVAATGIAKCSSVLIVLIRFALCLQKRWWLSSAVIVLLVPSPFQKSTCLKCGNKKHPKRLLGVFVHKIYNRIEKFGAVLGNDVLLYLGACQRQTVTWCRTFCRRRRPTRAKCSCPC